MLKLCFKIMSAFWILSPLIFIMLRVTGIFNFPFDWAIEFVLTIISGIAMFFNIEHA